MNFSQRLGLLILIIISVAYVYFSFFNKLYFTFIKIPLFRKSLYHKNKDYLIFLYFGCITPDDNSIIQPRKLKVNTNVE